MNALLLLLACADPTPPAEKAVDCPAAAAPTVDLADALAGHRLDEVDATTAWTGPRSLPLHLWYPTTATTGAPVDYLGFMNDPQSLGDAPVALPEGCTLPLVVYSHGYQGWAGNGTDVLRQFVRNGWIAAAPDHVGNTLTDNMDPLPASFDLTRVADISAVIDHLASLPSDDPLAGHIDADHVLVLGHSYGAQTAWLLAGPTLDPAAVEAACTSGCTPAEEAAFAAPLGDPSVVAVAPLDGTANSLTSADSWSRRSAAVFAFSRPGDEPAEAYARAAGDGVIWAQFAGACHETFTSTPVSCEIPKEEGLALVSEYLLAWGAKTVMGQTAGDALLAGDTVLDARITVLP